MTDGRVILSVDAIAFRPMATISDDGSVDGLKDLTHLDNPDLLTQFLTDHFRVSERTLGFDRYRVVCL
jgi:hypothetical protein